MRFERTESPRHHRRNRGLKILLALVAIAAFVAGTAMASLGGFDRDERRGQPEVLEIKAEPEPSAPEETGGPPSPPPPLAEDPAPAAPPANPKIDYRKSKAVGDPWAGKLKRGVLLPREAEAWFSWDPIKKRTPSRQWRRWGTDALIRTTVRTLRQWRKANPGAPRLPIGDLSRPKGGDFGPQYGSIGHSSHQNGLDIDIYYPRKDGKPKPPDKPSQVRIKPSQDLVDRFVKAGAEKVFVGPNLPLTGPSDVVVPLAYHDNHIHVRILNPGR